MDTKFQTSFIPKKSSIVEQKVVRHSKSTNVFTVIAVVLFLVSVAGAAYSVLWKGVLMKNQEKYENSLKDIESDFDVETINKLRGISAKLELGQKLIQNHIAVSTVFDILNSLTIEGVKFDTFSFLNKNLDGTPGITVELKGVGKNFSSIAYQSDVFGQSQKFGVSKVLRNPIVSDLILNENGTVGFKLKANVEQSDILYVKSLDSSTDNQ